MKNYSSLPQDSQDELLNSVKRFFGFGEQPDIITILLPRVERSRHVSLECQNYPLFSYEVSPDDAFTALRIYSLLVLLYGDRVQVQCCTDLRAMPLGHRVLIGSSVTNLFSSNAVRDQYYHFGRGAEDHSIITQDGEKYTVLFDQDEDTPLKQRHIIRDYSLISKCTRQNGVEVVLAGCRAYCAREP